MMQQPWLMALGACASLSCAATPPGLPDIDGCVGHLDPQIDIGYERIAAKCPQLLQRLEQGSWVAWLPRGWKEPGNDLSVGSLKELRELVSREEAAHAVTRAPDVHALKASLDGLAEQQAQGGWARFKSWLRSILEAREQTAQESWFSRMVAQVGLSQSLRQLIAYTALGAVVVLAGVILVNELRATGWLSRRRSGGRSGAAVKSSAHERTLSELEQSALLERPRLLLELLVQRLAERGFLPPARSLTVQELTRVVRLSDPEDRARLENVAATAERVRYSARSVEPLVVEKSVVRGRELLAQLETKAPSASGVPS
jgi:hypothetical protein